MRLSTTIKLGLALWFICEIFAFAMVADWIGFLPAFLITIVTGLFGWTLLKRAGASAMVKLRATIDGRVPGGDPNRFLDETLATFGALALMMPGFLSDLIGLALAVPALRDRLADWAGRRGFVRFRSAGGGPRTGPATIDLDPQEWRRNDPTQRPASKV